MNQYMRDIGCLYEQYIINTVSLVNEMFVIGDNIGGDYFIVAHKDKIFRLDLKLSDTNQSVLSSMSNTFQLDIDDFKKVTNIYSLIFLITSKNANNLDILFGYYVESENKLIILDEYFNIFKDPHKSILVKKVYKQLNLSKVVLQSDTTIGFTRDDIVGENESNLFYHGTTSTYILDILKKGLDNKISNTNFPRRIKILNHNKQFITSNFKYALNHAIRVSNMRGGYPIIVEFKVRMPDLLQPDYDIQKQTGLDYNNALKSSREAGIYGYSDRILPTDFQNIHITNQKKDLNQYDESDFKLVDWQVMKNYLTLKEMTYGEVLELIFAD